MKRKQGSTIFLKVVIFLIGIAVLAVCIFGLPGIASSDAAAHPETALQYPFLVYAYVLCIPFYVALYQAFKLLTYIDKNKAFSELSVRALRYIKYCAITISILIVVGIIISVAIFYGSEDITGIIMLALISIFASSVIATFAAVLQKLLKEAIDIKSENDLTV
ncbi:DUF2975 domain-containing protein [Bacillus sp. 03113]|uniref:DUF2975 domain-containing protein n=1 Tax=Bacillus sp. 03113 TaxID=2578211 RepID=UPI0011417CB2|nr:DUF2975 domain-containing protein [Bacillus sp. 03113]